MFARSGNYYIYPYLFGLLFEHLAELPEWLRRRISSLGIDKTTSMKLRVTDFIPILSLLFISMLGLVPIQKIVCEMTLQYHEEGKVDWTNWIEFQGINMITIIEDKNSVNSFTSVVEGETIYMKLYHTLHRWGKELCTRLISENSICIH